MLKTYSKLSFLALILIFSCKKSTDTPTPEVKETPKVETTDISVFTNSTADCGGNVLSIGSSALTDRGICWDTTSTPTIAKNKKSAGTTIGVFSVQLTNLNSLTKYYVRAYATNSVGTTYGVEKSITTKELIAIGEKYAGGLIFYLDASNNHGLVCAEADQGTFNKWGCASKNIPGALGIEIGKGQANTTAILSNCSDVYTGADVCNKLVLNGYDDWFLPSINELELIYLNIHKKGKGGFTETTYWSSTQTAINSTFAQTVHFYGGNTQSGGKDNPTYVRAVRAF
jgi:hypothetical protein